MPNGDYHIYIHSEGVGGGSSSKTIPFENRSAEEQESSSSISPYVQKGLSFVGNEVGGSGNFSSMVSSGIAVLSKVVPWLAIAIAAVKITDMVVTTGLGHQEEYLGDYKNNMDFNNFKTTISNAINPIGLLKNQMHRQAQFSKYNVVVDQQRTLVGNALRVVDTKGV